MIKYLKPLLLISLTSLLLSCGGEKGDEPEAPSSNAEYYVKYEATVTSLYTKNNIQYTVNTEKGLQTFFSDNTFSQTFGPVNKGFEASITIDARNSYSSSCEARIYVCRGNEPFALKKHGVGEKQATISYKIDY